MKRFFLLVAFFCYLTPASSGELVFAVSTGTAMPHTQFQQGQLTGGLIKAFGDALAQELGMSARYLLVPRKRLEAPLRNGAADVVCDMRPEWLDGKDWQWSEAIFANHEIVATRRDTPAIRSIYEIRRQRIGTILGYHYPHIEQPLEGEFTRDDAANNDQNVAKLLRKRFTYIITNRLYYDYQRKVHPERAALNPATYTVWTFETYCALPPRSKLSLATLDRAILSLKRRGKLQSILDSFRPSRSAPAETP
ncbi:substrate-binding periplasmic protein [Duganella qianjiadongensis]|uniref:Transporter substrate-binding domain-containing protein n=1 Tax=Duganella qianjiadongensis TaxID=2692176 RepID=A0ABW9VEI8_9BURK|nr:transporter substrate-binding domain-containing protein [Duganella qianjiadongensis]MYM38024.1 transporter substrate-binding domain-containing protein [Duganella qianjiadongensis]